MKLLKTDSYLLWADDNKPSRNGKYSLTITGKVKKFLPDEQPVLWIDGCPEVIAHLPLNNAPVLEGVLLLPEDETMYLLSTKANKERLLSELPKQEEDVKWKSLAHSIMHKMGVYDYVIAPVDTDKWLSNLADYLKLSQGRMYSEVDMKKAYYQGHKSGLGSEGAMTFTQMLQSLSPATYPVAFEPEYEVVPDDNNNGSGVIFTNNMKEVFKTIQTEQGEQIVGRYKYE